jgi:hypothetical protein
MRALLLLLLTVPAWAADDVTTILKRLVDAERKNEKVAQQYTYTEVRENFAIDKTGKERLESAAKHEVVFVEGLEYHKLVEKNGRPLNAREQARVEKAMSETADYRRKHQRPATPGGVISMNGLLTHKKADLGSVSELLTLFQTRLAGEEEIRGRKAWVVEAEPRTDKEHVNEHEKQVLGFRKKLWIDQKDSTLVRGVYTVIGEDSFLRPGSVLSFDFDKVDSDAWHMTSIGMTFSMSKEKTFRPTGRMVYRMGNFHKFDVQSTITPLGVNK